MSQELRMHKSRAVCDKKNITPTGLTTHRKKVSMSCDRTRRRKVTKEQTQVKVLQDLLGSPCIGLRNKGSPIIRAVK